MDNEWKNSLRERFSDYASPEPEGLWEGIEQGMAGKPRRKMLPVWIVSGLAAAAAAAPVAFLSPGKAPGTPHPHNHAPHRTLGGGGDAAVCGNRRQACVCGRGGQPWPRSVIGNCCGALS